MMGSRITIERHDSFVGRLMAMPWGLVLLLSVVAFVGCMALYSAGSGSLSPWALKHGVRYGMALGIMFALAMVDVRIWYKLAYPIYAVAVILLIIVDVMGHVGMGAQRWINLGFMKLQPSEIMKIASVLMMARYFHGARIENLRNPLFVLPPLAMVGLPVALVMLQPDLGTALMIVFVAGCVFFVSGVALWMFMLAGGAALAALPIAWSLLHDYQKNRVLTFMNPEADPLGTGYHITQSKIALGSAGCLAKGICKARKAIWIFCRRSTPILSLPCGPRNGDWWAAAC